MIWKKFLPLLPVLLLAGCCRDVHAVDAATNSRAMRTTFIPSRSSSITKQQSVRWDSVKPYVLVKGELYPLRPVPVVPNRWEGLVPVPPTANGVTYRFKFDYLYNNFGTEPKPDSAFSPEYNLQITDQ